MDAAAIGSFNDEGDVSTSDHALDRTVFSDVSPMPDWSIRAARDDQAVIAAATTSGSADIAVSPSWVAASAHSRFLSSNRLARLWVSSIVALFVIVLCLLDPLTLNVDRD
jgi:hypothetical protein